MSYTLKNLKKHITNDSLHSVYLLLGNEDFLQKESLKLISQKVIPNSEYKDFNLDIFTAPSISVRKIVESIETLPVFLDKRLVICHDVHLFKESDWKILLPSLKNPPLTSIIVLTALELDKRKKTSKQIIETSSVVETSNPKQQELEKWVQYLAHNQNLQISESAVNLLIRWAGPSISSMNNEIKK